MRRAGHLGSELLDRLSRLALERPELESAAWHLYRCRVCRKRLEGRSGRGRDLLSRIFRDLPPAGRAGGYSRAFASVRRRMIAEAMEADAEARQVAELVEGLLTATPPERVARVAADPLHRSLAIAEALLDRCWSVWGSDPAAAESIARLALSVLDQLDRREEVPAARRGVLCDLRARALSHVANCRRIRFDLGQAEQLFAEALEQLSRGSGDPLERAHVLALMSTLRRAQRRLDEGLQLSEHAGRVYRELGDRRRLASSLIQRARLESELGRKETAIATLSEALAQLSPDEQPALWLMAAYNRVTEHYELGRLEEAREGLAALRPLMARHASAADRLRYRWFDAVVARDAGEHQHAEELFRETRAAFVALDDPYDVALISLDLALLLLAQGRIAETRALAEEMLPIFQSREIPREATAALLLFHRAAVAETVTTAMVREVATAVRGGQAQGGRRGAEKPS